MPEDAEDRDPSEAAGGCTCCTVSSASLLQFFLQASAYTHFFPSPSVKPEFPGDLSFCLPLLPPVWVASSSGLFVGVSLA